MSLLDAVQTARGNSSVSPTSKPTTSGTTSLLGAVQVARGGVSPTPTSAPKPVGPVTIAKPQNESLLSKIGGYVTSTLNNLIAKVPSNTQDKIKMATNIASKLVTSQPQIKAAVTIAKNPVVAKYTKDSVDIGKDALKNGIETIKGAGQLTFPYQVYRAAIGKPVNASEYAKNVLSFGLDIIGLQWRATPLAPVVGAVSSQEKQLRQMAQNGKLKWDDLLKLSVGSLAGPIGRAAVGASIAGKDSLVEGINTQPGVGETFTDNVKLAQAIDTVFLGAMFAAPFVHAKISDLNVKASNFLDRIKPLDVSPNATMKEVTEAVRSKMKAHPDAFTLDPTEAGMKARAEITDALNAFKDAGFIDKKYAQAFDFFAKRLGIDIAPLATDIQETPKQLTDGKVPEVKPLNLEGIDKNTSAKMTALNTADAKNPVAEGKVRVYQAISKGNTTDYVFKDPELLAKYKNNVTAPEEEFKYMDVTPEQVKPVEGKPDVYKVDTSEAVSGKSTTAPHLLKNQTDVKLETQKEDGWCGPAALQYALKEQGFDISQETLANGMGATVSQGADPGQITSEAKKQGLQTETIQGEDAQKTLATLDTALSEGKSVILDFLDGKDLQNDGHYVLYQGREGGNITVMDPQTGKPRNIDEQKFIDQWKDTTIKGNLFKRWATIIEKTPQVLGGKPEKRIIGRSKYATTGIREVLSSSESPEDSVNKLDTFVKDFVKGADQSNMADLRAGLVKEIDSLVGGTGNYKRDYAVRVAMRDDTEVGGLVRALEKHISDIDSTIKDYPEKNTSPAESVPGSETSITIPAEVNQAGQTPVGEGKLRESTAYKKIKSRISEELQLDVKYNPVNLTADIEKAVEFLDKNPKKAVQVALGLEKAPEGQLERNITIATSEKALADGDIELWNQIESSGSLRQTRKGQEIVADRGRFNDNSPHTYMRELISRRLDKLGYSFKQALKDAGRKVGSTKEAAIAKIDERTAKLREKLKKDQGKIKLAQDIIDLLRC